MFNRYYPLWEYSYLISSELSKDEIEDYLIELEILLHNGRPSDESLANGTLTYGGVELNEVLINLEKLDYVRSAIYNLREQMNNAKGGAKNND